MSIAIEQVNTGEFWLLTVDNSHINNDGFDYGLAL